MACDAVRAAISAAADGEPVDVDAAHLASCAACASFDRSLRSVRAALRFELVDEVPDVAPAVLARVSRDRGPVRARPALAVAAALVAGVLVGAGLERAVTPAGDGVAAALPALVAAAQPELRSLAADVTVVEHAPDREQRGRLRWQSPEALELRFPDVRLLTDGATWRLEAPDGTRAVTGREPFAESLRSPLDVVLPTSAFAIGEAVPSLGRRAVGGREAVGTEVTVARVAALLDGLRPAGGRPLHVSDRVELWLDAEHLVPLRVVVRAADGPDRRRWAAARGLDEAGGTVLLEARFEGVVVNGAVDVPAPTPGAGDDVADAGFRDTAVDVPAPTWLPAGMAPHRSGQAQDGAGVRTWSDGRAWVKVRATASWGGRGLFGGVGSLVRRVAPGTYVAEDGRAVAVHAGGHDVVVRGTVDLASLVRIARSLPVTPVEIPPTWPETATASVSSVGTAALLLPDDAGFAAPAARVDGDRVLLSYAGDGTRGLLVASRPGTVLAPPLEPDVVGIVVRGRPGRWSPGRSELEWVEDGRLWAVRSRTVGLVELVALADRLERP